MTIRGITTTRWSVAPLRHAARGGAALAVVTLVAGAFTVAPAQAAPTPSVGLAAVAQRPAAPRGAQVLGALSATRALAGDVALKPSNPSGLAAYAASVSNPSSPQYRHYLTPGAFATLFGPSATTIEAVKSHLVASGLTVTSVSKNGLLIGFEGTVGTVGREFHTSFASYRLSSGRQAFAPTGSLLLPSDVAASVQSVVGLSTVVLPQTVGALQGSTGHHAASAPVVHAVPGGPSACAGAAGAATSGGGLTDSQIAAAYGLNGLLSKGDNGTGQTIAVYELEPFSAADQSTFDTCYYGAGEARAMASRLNVIPVDGGQPSGVGSGEAELDIDDVSALAPGATINVYEGPNSNAGYLDTFNQIIEDDTAKIVTSSWGSGCETQVATAEPGLMQVENTIFEQAAAQGQTVLDAAGDEGSDGCGYHATAPVSPILSSEDPSSQPYVLSVGGTAITNATTPPQEQVWNDGAAFGAGSGGISAIWPAPSWQVASGVPGFDNSTTVNAATTANGGPFCATSICRETPDVSAQADEFTGAVTVYQSQYGGWTTFGGTSSSTPLWAAMLADIDSTQACVSDGGIGFVTPSLYAIAGNPTEYATSFNDVTLGNNDQFEDAGGLYPATTGYDMATGLGSPRITNPNGTPGLAHYLCTLPSSQTPTVVKVAPAALPASGGAVTITGTGFESGSLPDVDSVQVGTTVLSQSAFSVKSATQITATLPPSVSQAGTGSTTDGTGTYDVTVALDDGAVSAPSPASTVIFYAGVTTEIPEVNGIEASGGNVSGGNTVTLYGSGFTSGTSTPVVTFGGVPGSNVRVISDSELSVTVPAYGSGTTTCATALTVTTDGICQAEVQVTTSLGASQEQPILPEYSAAVATDTTENSEQIAASTEYDYLPTPAISSILVSSPQCSTTTSPQEACASEAGGTIATIEGTGLGSLGLLWANVGSYTEAASQDTSFSYVSPTELQISLPSQSTTTKVASVPVTIETLASSNVNNATLSPPSNSVDVSYAPIPVLRSIQVLHGSAPAPIAAGPATGGTTIVISGKGLGSALAVGFTDVGSAGGPHGFSDAASYTLESVSPTSVTVKTPANNAGIDQISVCDASGCTSPTANPSLDTFVFFPVGDPVLTSLSVAKATAGSKIIINGENLGFVTGVFFGSNSAAHFANVPAVLDSGSTSQVSVKVPTGIVGSRVSVRVVTLASTVDGFGKSRVTPAARFTYLP